MKDIAGILEKARSLFDVACVTRDSEGGILLVLGLESTPERDLDDFGHADGKFYMYGFEKYVAPGLNELVEFISRAGYSAGAVGRIGYPLKGEVNLKEEVIRSGIGKRGKNTVVLHPEYGPRLRFIAVRTDAPFDVPERGPLTEEENPVCRDCSICIDNCPVQALEPYRMPDISTCLSNVSPVDEEGKSILCDICLKMCPAGRKTKILPSP